jgi:ATP-binding cassette subfamily F protein 3
LVQIRNLSKGFGEQLLLSDVSFILSPGEKAGLIGRNGSGKSTLFKILTGEMHPDGGQIELPKNYRIGYLQQHLKFSEPDILSEVCKALPHNDEGWQETWKAESILSGLGFSEADFKKPASLFSGGFQIRLNLAKVLLSEPNLLLLDEPTNYLDIVSIRWLERFLQQWSGELMLITHDRHFMDRVCTHTLGIYRKDIRKIQGPTLKFYDLIIQEEEIHAKTLENNARKREQVEKFINRFRAQANKAKAVQSRVKALEKMEKPEELRKEKSLDFAFTEKPFPGKRMLKAENISFRFGENLPWLIKNLSLEVGPRDRIAIIGPNGKGKTTLLNLLAGEFAPLAGDIQTSPNLAVGYFGQTNVDRLHPEQTIEEEILLALDSGFHGRARTLAGLMMFEGDHALKKIKVISGGEKSRVLLAKILANPANLLLLDEPTNHLDMESVDSLCEAVLDFNGSVIMVTHNEDLLHNIASRFIVFDNDRVFHFEGTYAEFLKQIGWQDEKKGRVPGKHQTEDPVVETDEEIKNKKELRKIRAEQLKEKNRALKPLETKLSRIERDIENNELLEKRLHRALIDASEAGDALKITEISQKLKETESARDLLWQDFEKTTEALDQLSESL